MKCVSLVSAVLLLFLVSCGQKSAKVKSVTKTKEGEQNLESFLKKKSPTDNMVFFKGATFTMGNSEGTPREAPEHPEIVTDFYLDQHPVTVKQFREFIKETGHTTEAQKFGDSMVFSFSTRKWSLVPGTTWEYPRGPEGEKAEDDHPVTHVSWYDAEAFTRWAGKRLPTEAEWEYAARNSGQVLIFPWGNELLQGGKWMCNGFQGGVPQPLVEDGFLYTSPVGNYGVHASGLSDMAGNVWEWLADTYQPYEGSAELTPVNPDVKCIRGGSFMYDAALEASLSTTFRSFNTAESSLFNTGFRCAFSAE